MLNRNSLVSESVSLKIPSSLYMRYLVWKKRKSTANKIRKITKFGKDKLIPMDCDTWNPKRAITIR
jgi:hypothetical protein